MSLFYLKSCTSVKGTPWSTAWFTCCCPHLPVVNKFLCFWPSQTEWKWLTKLIKTDWSWMSITENRSKSIESRQGPPGGKPVKSLKKMASAISHGRWGKKKKHLTGLGAENKSALFLDFLLLSAVLRARGRFQNPRQFPVRTKLTVETLSEWQT